MSLFVHPDNQSILWESLHQRSEIQHIPTHERSTWFKYHIQSVYEKIPRNRFEHPLTTAQLNELNKYAFETMLQDLVREQKAAHPSPSPPFAPSQERGFFERPLEHRNVSPRFSPGNLSDPTFHSGPSLDMREGNDIESRFLQKQQEMDSMLNVQPPKQIDFTMTELDGPISNMDELLQKQMKEREYDLASFPPPPPPPLVPPVPLAPTSPPPPPPLTLAQQQETTDDLAKSDPSLDARLSTIEKDIDHLHALVEQLYTQSGQRQSWLDQVSASVKPPLVVHEQEIPSPSPSPTPTPSPKEGP